MQRPPLWGTWDPSHPVSNWNLWAFDARQLSWEICSDSCKKYAHLFAQSKDCKVCASSRSIDSWGLSLGWNFYALLSLVLTFQSCPRDATRRRGVASHCNSSTVGTTVLTTTTTAGSLAWRNLWFSNPPTSQPPLKSLHRHQSSNHSSCQHLSLQE